MRFFVILLCLGVALSSPLELRKFSDMEVGTLGPDDEHLTTLGSETFPNPGIITNSVIMGARGDGLVFTYITVKESGQWPEARSYLHGGGPGMDNFQIRMEPGAPQGHNYTIRAYGKILQRSQGQPQIEITKEVQMM